MGRFSAATVVAVAAAATALLACPADARLVGSARQADVAAAVLDETPYRTEEALVDVGFETAEPVDDFLGEEELPAETEAVLGEEELPAETGAVLGEEELPAETEAVLGDEVYPTHTPYPSEEVAVEPMAYPVQTAMPYSMPTAVVQEGKPVYSGPRKFAPTLAAAQQMTYDAYMQWLSAMPAPYVPIHQQQKPVYTPVTKKVVVAKQPVLVQAPRPVKPLAAVQQLPFLVPHGQGLGRPGPRVVTASGVTSYSAEVAA